MGRLKAEGQLDAADRGEVVYPPEAIYDLVLFVTGDEGEARRRMHAAIRARWHND